MGNSQSAPDIREQHRLSKPRTHAGNSPGSIATFSKRDLGLSTSRLALGTNSDVDSAVESPTRDRWSKQDVMQLLRSQQSLPDAADEEADDDSLGELAVTVKDRLSRSGSRATKQPSTRSSTSQLNSASMLSLPAENEPRPIDLETAVAILQELRKTASPEDLVALHKALLPTRPRDQPSPTKELQVESSGAALIRRKSLAIPGLATRRASRSEQQRTSTLIEEEGNLWRPEMICASPLAKLSNLDGVGKHHTVYEAPRAETPAGSDYAQLGTMKLGSLVVTNGMASPALSMASQTKLHMHSTSISNQDDDFFTASEGGSPGSRKASDEFGPPLRPPPPPPTDPGYNYSSTVPDRSQQRGRKVERETQNRDGSPLKNEVRAETPRRDSFGSVIRRPLPQQELRATRSAVSLLSEDTRYSFDGDLDQPAFPMETHKNRSAVSLASEYIAGLPSSPFVSATDLASGFGDNNEYTTAFDEYVDEGYYDASPDIEEQRLAALASLDGSPNKTIQIGEITPDTALRSHPPPKMATRPAPKPKMTIVTKADSGYSSSASGVGTDMRFMRSQDVPTSFPTTPVVARRTPIAGSKPAGSSEGALNLYSFRHFLTQEPPPIPGATHAVTDLDGVANARPPIERSRSWKKSVRKSLPRIISSDSTVTVATKSSKASSTSQSAPKKLQKRRPLSFHYPLNLRNPHKIDGVPRVPSEVFTRFSGRITDKPEMEHLEPTRADLRSTERSETSGSEQFDIEYSFPDSEDEYTALQRSRLARADSERPPPTPPHRFGIRRVLSKPRLRRKSTAGAQEELISAADFRDAAAPRGSQKPLPNPPTHPYQLNSNQTRSGPVAGMDDETASRFAHMRSQHRAAMRVAHETQSRPDSDSRPQSFHEGSLPTGGRLSRIARRPKSVHGEQAESESIPLPRLRPRSMGPPQDRRSYSSVTAEHEPIPLLQHTVSYPCAQPPAHTAENIPSASLDWSAQSTIWRRRKLSAKTTVNTTTTTSNSITTSGPRSTTTVVRSKPITTTTTTTTTIGTASLRPKATTTTTTVARKPAAVVPAAAVKAVPPVAKYAHDGLFGRYGGGLRHGGLGLAGKRDVTGRTGAIRGSLGVDLGDVPSSG